MRRASVLLLSQPGGATTVPTSYGGGALCAWQQAQLEPTRDGAFKADDPLYLLLALAKKFRFVAAASLYLTASHRLVFNASLYDEASLPAVTQVAASPCLAASAGLQP